MKTPIANFDFVVDPDNFRKESATSSRWLTLYLPIIYFFAAPVVAFLFTDFFNKWFHSERFGIFEFLHFLLPLITGVIGLRLAMSRIIRSDPILFCWCLAIFVGGIFLAGEEASWGQHYFGWITPDSWATINDQQETNLHNLSNVFDQLPRGILVFGIVITGTLNPWLILNRPGLLPRQFNFTYPPLALVPLAILTALVWVYRGANKFEALMPYIQYRPGEFQELLIVWFLLYYAIFLLRRERQLRDQLG